MALKFLIDLLTGNLVLVEISSGGGALPPSGFVIPTFAGFILIPQ